MYRPSIKFYIAGSFFFLGFFLTEYNNFAIRSSFGSQRLHFQSSRLSAFLIDNEDFFYFYCKFCGKRTNGARG